MQRKMAEDTAENTADKKLRVGESQCCVEPNLENAGSGRSNSGVGEAVVRHSGGLTAAGNVRVTAGGPRPPPRLRDFTEIVEAAWFG